MDNPQKSPLGLNKEGQDHDKSAVRLKEKELARAREERYHNRNHRETKHSGGILIWIILLLLIGGIAYGAYWWFNQPEPVVDTQFLVYDKLLIPGTLLTASERSTFGYSKADWVEPKFILYVTGQDTGRVYAYEVDEKSFLYIPRNTLMVESEFIKPAPLASALPNTPEAEIMKGMLRFSTNRVGGVKAPPVVER